MVARWAQSAQFKLDTKLNGDIAEQAAVLYALRKGWGVLKPVGDRLLYNLVFDVQKMLVKVQVKLAWFDAMSGNYVADNRRTKTNRRTMIRGAYSTQDFDFALVYLAELDLFYVLPVEVFIGYRSGIHFVETERRQRKPGSAAYRDAWNLIVQWAAREAICVCLPVKFGEASCKGNPEPSLGNKEGVET